MARYFQRSYPHGALRFAALEQDKYKALGFSASAKVSLYTSDGADNVTIISIHETVSAGNTAGATWEAANGRTPKLVINYWHSDFTLYPVGPVQHPDARQSYPSWLDEAPAY